MAMLPLLRIIAGEPGWTAAAAAGQPIIAALDLGFFIAGVWLVWRGIRMGARRSVASESSVAVAL